MKKIFVVQSNSPCSMVYVAHIIGIYHRFFCEIHNEDFVYFQIPEDRLEEYAATYPILQVDSEDEKYVEYYVKFLPLIEFLEQVN